MDDVKTEPAESIESFELLKHLGSGGFAHTYLARVCAEELAQEYGTDQVALKIPLSRQKARALKRDIELNAALHLRLKDMRSVNIVRYLGFDFYKGQPVMVMHYMPNGSLRKIIGGLGRQKRLPIEETVRITIEILEGLSVIHEKLRAFHGNLTPENVLMDGETPKISYLGISMMLGLPNEAKLGNCLYESPEFFEGEMSIQSDIWSVGVMLCEMATGRLPFDNKDTPLMPMTDLVRRSDHVPAPEVCPDVRAVIDCALSKRPAQRFRGPREMHDALANCVLPPSFKPSGPAAAAQPDQIFRVGSRETSPLKHE